MLNQAHISYPFLLALLVGVLFGYHYSTFELFIVMMSAWLPDFAYLYFYDSTLCLLACLFQHTLCVLLYTASYTLFHIVFYVHFLTFLFTPLLMWEVVKFQRVER